MAQYIDKDALVAEIERRREYYENIQMIKPVYESNIEDFNELLSFLNTLEVKVTDEVKIGETQIYLEDDGGEPPYDGKQWLDLSCTEYEIPKALFKDGDNVEILIRKAQKGK